MTRWEPFLTHLEEAIQTGGSFDEAGETRIIEQIEVLWQHLQGGLSTGGESYLVEPKGDVMTIVRRIRRDYLEIIEETDEESIYAEELPSEGGEEGEEEEKVEDGSQGAPQAESGHN